MDDKLRGILGAVVAGALGLCVYCSWQMSVLSAARDRVYGELDRTRKMAQLLARTSVVENGLRYGGREVIESLLNQSVLGERQIESVWVTESGARSGIRNTYSADGLYVGMSEPALPSMDVGSLNWSSMSLSDGRVGMRVTVPVEQDDSPVGSLSVVVDGDELVRKAIGADFPARLRFETPMGSLAVAFLDVGPALRLVLPFAKWWLPATLCAILGAALFWLYNLWAVTLRLAREERAATREALYLQALQVAHDIRSPLAALTTLDPQVQRLGAESLLLHRTAVQRIHGIADGLLTKFRAENFGPSYSWLGHVACGLVEEIGSAEDTVEIEIPNSQRDWNVCIAARPGDLERVLDNLLRNASDACKSKVRLRWTLADERVRIGIAHDGSLAAFKPIRNGLGLKALARLGDGRYEEPTEIVDKWGQTWIECALTLNLAHPPIGCPEKLSLIPGVPIVVLDDDPQVVDWFRERVSLCEVSSAWDRESLERLLARLEQPAQFIVDFRLGPGQPTGPELLDSMVRSSVARHLVTSMPEEPGVLEVAARWNTDVIPKFVLFHIPLDFGSGERHEPSIKQAVLVDDDALTCRSWEMSALERGVRLRVMRSVEQMDALVMGDAETVSTPVFIDGGLTTTEFLERLARRGFRDVYITTGNPTRAARFAGSVRGILSKSPPWAA